jgi:2-oxoglutarate ferredoxin oxidoreductase subunit alpha
MWHLSQKIDRPKELMFGNQLLAEGAISAGLEFYSAYPMTPVTSLLETIIEHPEVTFFQGEDEIAVAMAMLGARFAGKRAMCATSGGGFSLMSESISFAHQAEIGGVYIL